MEQARREREEREERQRHEELQRQQAQKLLELIQRRARTVTLTSPLTDPESQVNQITEYLSGWVDAIDHSGPELTASLSELVEDELCAPRASGSAGTAQMMYGRMLRMLPKLATSESFDCYFQHASKEDVVLWEGMDAWRASKLPKPEALAQIERAATKEQTQFRLLSQDEQRARLERIAAALPSRTPSPAAQAVGIAPDLPAARPQELAQ